MGFFFVLLLVVGSSEILFPHRHGDRNCALTALTGRVESSAAGADPFLVAAFGRNATMLSSWVPTKDLQFSLQYASPVDKGLVFVVAKRQAVQLVAVLHKSRPTFIIVNANTTVAFSYGLAQFLQLGTGDLPFKVEGPFVGTKNAGQVSFVLADSRTGKLSAVLQDSFNRNTTTQAKFFKLVNVLETCQATPQAVLCVNFTRATARTNVILGIARLATSPGIDVAGLSIAPDDWMMPVVLTATGNASFGMFGPGGIAFDPEGNLYICENLQYGTTTECNGMACPALYFPILQPDGDPHPLSPFFGGVLGATNGTGFGMSINRKTLDLWAGSFQDLSPNAFVGMGDPNAGFVTHFGPAPNRPLIQIYKDSKCAGVQGVNSDAQGNVFFACLTTSTVCRIDAVNNSYICVSNEFLRNPFDVDTDSEGNVWVSDANAFTSPSYAVKLSNSLQFILAVKLPPPSRADVDNRTLPGTSAKAIVVDSFDNVWVSNWRGNSVSAFSSSGVELPNSPFPVKGTWGISLDGRDNIYLAGFGAPETFDGHFVAYMCGASSSECSPGQLLSFAEGWGRHNGAFQRLVDVQTASSGSVWVSNNWQRQPTPLNAPGGNGMVVMPGMGVPPKKLILG